MKLLCLLASLYLAWPLWSYSGVIFSDEELRAAGRDWQRIRNRWHRVDDYYSRRIEAIRNRTDLDPARKARWIETEKKILRRKSNKLAWERDRIQRMLIDETNARLHGHTAASEPIRQTAGTRLGDSGHRGMRGDLDAGGGVVATQRLKEVITEMGLDVPIVEHPGTLELGDGFEFTINKTGIAPKPGGVFHQTVIAVNARNHETYVSESMKTRAGDGTLIRQQAGADYVTVQDHKKKAMDGLLSSGEDLVRDPDTMQEMSKGTRKALRDARIDDQTLEKILKQRGVRESPSEFRERLQAIKEQRIQVTDVDEARRLRDVANDIFHTAERKTLRQARREMTELKQRIRAEAAAGHKETAQRLREEYVDSRVKIEETGLANEEQIARRRGLEEPPRRPRIDAGEGAGTRHPSGGEVGEGSGGRRPAGGTHAAPHGKPGWKTRAMKGYHATTKTIGVIMTISDIGQASQTVEDYLSGKISLKEAALRIAEQSPVGGIVSATRKAGNSWSDYQAASKAIAAANRANREAYYQQWFLRLVKAGVDKRRARELVGDAMLSGDDTELDHAAIELQLRGKHFERPKLVIDTFEADDTVGDRILETGKGILVGTYHGVRYILTAPKRVVEAWAQGRLAEADLKLRSAEQLAWSKSRMYRLVRAAGIPRRAALRAVNDFYDNNHPAGLRRMLAVIRKNQAMRARWRKESRRLIGARTRLHDWYCTNRPVIESDAPLSGLINEETESINEEIRRRNRIRSWFGLSPIEEL